MDERVLLDYLDMLHEKGVRFAFSNMLDNKGYHNDVLEVWISEHPEYKMIDLDYNYNNANYHGNKSDKATREILIINY